MVNHKVCLILVPAVASAAALCMARPSGAALQAGSDLDGDPDSLELDGGGSHRAMTPAEALKVDKAIALVKAVCPAQDADELELRVHSGDPTQRIGIRAWEKGDSKGVVDIASHDNNTIAVDFNANQSIAQLAASLVHEWKHVKSANGNYAAGAGSHVKGRRDPSTNPADPGNLHEGLLAKYTHAQMAMDDLALLCKINKNSPAGQPKPIDVYPPNPDGSTDDQVVLLENEVCDLVDQQVAALAKLFPAFGSGASLDMTRQVLSLQGGTPPTQAQIDAVAALTPLEYKKPSDCCQ